MTGWIPRFSQPRIVAFVLSISLFAASIVAPSHAQESKADSIRTYDMDAIVVTATRSPSVLRDVPIPTRVIAAEQIRARGALRLTDLLAEEPGLILSHFLGAGIQLQGLDPAYTLILIDGEPVIGRAGGTLDLNRFPVTDIESIEIVQGPASSLYGNEALAGVINIRTRKPDSSLGAQAGLRLQSHGIRNVTGSFEGSGRIVSWRFNGDQLHSNGYDLHPETPGLTGPGFSSNTLSGRVDASLSESLEARLTMRRAREDQSNKVGFQQDGRVVAFDQEDKQMDVSISPSLDWTPRPGNTWTVRGHLANFMTESNLEGGLQGAGATRTSFEQGLRKIELHQNLIVGTRLILTSGVGAQKESVEANRIAGKFRSNQTTWVMTQQQFFVARPLELTAGFRVDHHSDYGWQVSPKAGFMIKSRNTIRVRGSVGTGFKAPSFQQLYMDYTNPVAGYSVIGSADALALLNRLERAGQIRTVLSDLSVYDTVTPESSLSFNMSGDTDLGRRLHLHVAAFRNKVRDLIETQPVAIKHNGQQVFSYVNLSRIVTQGLNAEIRFQYRPDTRLSLGYQWLDTRDLDVVAEIDRGLYFGRENGRDFRLTRADYGGLFGRSKHTGSIQFSTSLPVTGSDIQIRGVFKSRYGFGDRNGNLILDSDQEYVAGHMLWNVTINQPVSRSVRMQVGLVNALGFINPEHIPSLSGRQMFATLFLNTP